MPRFHDSDRERWMEETERVDNRQQRLEALWKEYIASTIGSPLAVRLLEQITAEINGQGPASPPRQRTRRRIAGRNRGDAPHPATVRRRRQREQAGGD
jgi:hypothetical protein